MFLVIIVIGLSAASINGELNSFSVAYRVDEYAMFLSVFTFLCLIFLGFTTFKETSAMGFSYGTAGVEFLLVLMWFALWIALAAIHGPESCDTTFVSGGILFRVPSPSPNFCKIGKANAAMSAVTWALFMASLGLLARRLWLARRSRAATGPGVGAAPAAPMAQTGPGPVDAEKGPQDPNAVPVQAPPPAVQPSYHTQDPTEGGPVPAQNNPYHT